MTEETPGEVPTEALIRQVVFGFYDRVRVDPLLAPVFDAAIAPEDWPHHLERMCDFWSSVLLKSGRFQGRPLQKHLGLPGLSDAHFHRWLSLFRHTVQDLCPPPVADLFLQRALMIAQSFRLALAQQAGQDLISVQAIGEADLLPLT